MPGGAVDVRDVERDEAEPGALRVQLAVTGMSCHARRGALHVDRLAVQRAHLAVAEIRLGGDRRRRGITSTVPEPMRVCSILLAGEPVRDLGVRQLRAQRALQRACAAPPERRASALTVPRYCTEGVMPAVSVASGSSLVMTVVDQAAAFQSPSAHTLPGVPTRHSHSTRT